MFSRPPLAWRRHAVAVAVLLLPLACPAATAACAGSPPAAFELSIASGVMRDGEESRIEVRAHADGCVAVHRPWFLRDAGDFELRLDAREWAALQGAVAPAELAKVDPQRLAAQTAVVWKEGANGAVVHADPDADTVVLQWRDAGRTHRLVARSPQAAAKRASTSSDLDRVATAVGALRALASRPGKRVGAEGTP